jgi:hypothetical protein
VSAYTLSVFSSLNTLGGILNSIVQSLADVDNLISLLAVVPEIQDSDGAIPLPIHKNRFSKDLGPTAGLSVQFEGCRSIHIRFSSVCSRHSTSDQMSASVTLTSLRSMASRRSHYICQQGRQQARSPPPPPLSAVSPLSLLLTLPHSSDCGAHGERKDFHLKIVVPLL